MPDTPSRFSIVIPVLNEAVMIRQCLQRLQYLRRAGHEVIVVDGGSSDDSVAIAAPLVDQLMHCERGRARQMNAGATLAQHNCLMFLHLDSCLPSNAQADLDAFALSKQCWGFFKVRLDDRAWAFRVIEFFMNQRSTLSAIATGDQTLVFKREQFFSLQGFAEIALMEDIELCVRLKRQGSKPWLGSAKVSCDTRKWRKHGIVRTTVLMWRLRLDYFFCADTDALHRRYYG